MASSYLDAEKSNLESRSGPIHRVHPPCRKGCDGKGRHVVTAKEEGLLTVRVCRKPCARSLFRLHRLDLAIARRPRSLKRRDQPACRLRDLVDGTIKGGRVGLRGLGEAAQLAHELQRRGADLVLGRGRLEVEQRANVAAHGRTPWRP